jgi:fimbrial isopeptide formation D2 family protein/LPXTG-motif cell wall-anchored protein
MTLVVVALVASLAMAGAAWAQTVGTAATDKGSITITNASKGETYKVTKIFDATVTGTTGGAIAYTGTIPEGLEDFFEYTDEAHSNVVLKKNADESALIAKLQELYGGDTTGGTVSDGTALTFAGLDYGYYVVATTQGEVAISVTSTNPAAEIVDKNTTEPTASKTVDDKDVYIGETVTYTLEFATTNWMGEGNNAKQVIKYDIEDTLPNYLSDVTVTSIKVDADGNTETTDDQTPLDTVQFNNKKITINWADEVAGSNPKAYQNKYNNGAKIIITYTAKVTAQANVGDADGNRNVVTLTPLVDKGGNTPEPWDETFKDDETIKTYGAAIHKVDDKGNSLKDAKFKIKGLTVTGSNGQYTVSGFDGSEDAALGTEMTVDDEGYIYILGLASDVALSVTETEAPDGYNKLTSPETLTPIKMSETTTYTTKTVYYDADGKVVHENVQGGTSEQITANYENLKEEANVLSIENKTGTELPSTGGIGTTILYIIGAVLVIGAGVFLVTKRRMRKEDNVQE